MNKITVDMLTRLEGPMTIEPSECVEAAAIYAAFHEELVKRTTLKLGADRIDPHAITWMEKVGVGCDSLEAGMLRLSLYAAKLLPDLVDWNEYAGGVFSYEFLETQTDDSHLSAFLIDYIEPNAWGLIADYYMLPLQSVMKEALSAWILKAGLPPKITMTIPTATCEELKGLMRLLLSMLSDLKEGYDWSELCLSYEVAEREAAALGVTLLDFDTRDAGSPEAEQCRQLMKG